jgi:signal transduction histidine kinase
VIDRTAALNSKTRELETFAYSVAHDLKAPLRGIEGYSRLLLDDHLERLEEEARTLLHTIRYSTAQMNQLIEDLLAYSRVERREIDLDNVDLGPFIHRVVGEKRNEMEGGRIDWRVSVNGGTVVADANGLAQALRNYLDNAIKFTRNAESPRIEVGVLELQDTCRVWVRDNGIGFDMKYHDRIFDIFQRLHRAEDYPGTGVGLAIVRKAVERMGGTVWAESEAGRGATFYLEVPKRSFVQAGTMD